MKLKITDAIDPGMEQTIGHMLAAIPLQTPTQAAHAPLIQPAVVAATAGPVTHCANEPAQATQLLATVGIKVAIPPAHAVKDANNPAHIVPAPHNAVIHVDTAAATPPKHNVPKPHNPAKHADTAVPTAPKPPMHAVPTQPNAAKIADIIAAAAEPVQHSSDPQTVVVIPTIFSPPHFN